MLKYILVPVLTLLLGCPGFGRPAYAATDGVIGKITETQGSVTLQTGGKPALSAAVNAEVHLQDVVATGANSRALIRFVDATQLTLSEKTKIKIDEYVFDPADGVHNKATYGILEGAFQYISGAITKTRDHDVKIQTSYGTIGIRGTQLWGGKIDGGYGVHVDAGRIVIQTAGGTVTVNAGEGTTLGGGTTPPTPPAAWSADKTRRALLTVLFGNPPPQGERHGENTPGPNLRDLPSDDLGGPEPFVPDMGGGGGGFNGGGDR